MHDGRFPLALADPALSWLRGKWTTAYVCLFLSLSLFLRLLFVIFVLRYEIAWYPLGNAEQCQLRTMLTRIEEGETN